MNLAMRVMSEHGAELHTLLLRLTLRRDAAEELMQELFVRLNGQGLANARQPAAYARRAAINLAMDWRRARKRRFSDDVEQLIAPTDSPATAAEYAEEVAQILDAAHDLSELARQAFVLRFIQQESYARIGEMLDKTPNQARGLCHAALRTIRQRLEKGQVIRGRNE